MHLFCIIAGIPALHTWMAPQDLHIAGAPSLPDHTHTAIVDTCVCVVV